MLEKATIQNTEYSLGKIREKQRLYDQKYLYLIKQLDDIPETEFDRWDVIWFIIRQPFKIVKIFYYIVRIYLLWSEKMDINKKTNIIAAIVLLTTTILSIFGITINAEILQIVVGAILTVALYFIGKKDKPHV